MRIHIFAHGLPFIRPPSDPNSDAGGTSHPCRCSPATAGLSDVSVYHHVVHHVVHIKAAAVFVISLTVWSRKIAPVEGSFVFSKTLISPYIASSGWCPGNAMRYSIICFGVMSSIKLRICSSTSHSSAKAYCPSCRCLSRHLIIRLLSVHSRSSLGSSEYQHPVLVFNAHSINCRTKS